jgi:hypothetical protein
MLVGLLGLGVDGVHGHDHQAGVIGVLPALLIYPALVARCVFAPSARDRTSGQGLHRGSTTAAERPWDGGARRCHRRGRNVGPAVGAALAVWGISAPLYCAAVLAVASAGLIWRRLPETERRTSSRRCRSATSTSACQVPGARHRAPSDAGHDRHHARPLPQDLRPVGEGSRASGEPRVRRARRRGAVAQLLIVQRLRPSARTMMMVGAPLDHGVRRARLCPRRHRRALRCSAMV